MVTAHRSSNRSASRWSPRAIAWCDLSDQDRNCRMRHVHTQRDIQVLPKVSIQCSQMFVWRHKISARPTRIKRNTWERGILNCSRFSRKKFYIASCTPRLDVLFHVFQTDPGAWRAKVEAEQGILKLHFFCNEWWRSESAVSVLFFSTRLGFRTQTCSRNRRKHVTIVERQKTRGGSKPVRVTDLWKTDLSDFIGA